MRFKKLFILSVLPFALVGCQKETKKELIVGGTYLKTFSNSITLFDYSKENTDDKYRLKVYETSIIVFEKDDIVFRVQHISKSKKIYTNYAISNYTISNDLSYNSAYEITFIFEDSNFDVKFYYKDSETVYMNRKDICYPLKLQN